jgi:hypothetical protein
MKIRIPEELLEKARFLIEECKQPEKDKRPQAPQVYIDLPVRK